MEAKTKMVLWEDVIFSLLAVYNCSLAGAFKHKSALENQGLLNPNNLAKWTSSEIVVKLTHAWPERGGLNSIFADRLEALGKYLAQQDLLAAEKILSSKDKEAIRAFLMPIKGVGEKVLDNFYELQGLS